MMLGKKPASTTNSATGFRIAARPKLYVNILNTNNAAGAVDILVDQLFGTMLLLCVIKHCVNVYHNGSLDGSTLISSSPAFANSNPITIGGQSGNFMGRNHHGKLDELRIYNRALSAFEVQALYDLDNTRPNSIPTNLISTAPLTIAENQPVGTVVGEFNATDPDAGATLTYQLVSGAGDGNNSLFTLETNGTLKTATTFYYETNASTYSICVQAKDEFNATVGQLYGDFAKRELVSLNFGFKRHAPFGLGGIGTKQIRFGGRAIEWRLCRCRGISFVPVVLEFQGQHVHANLGGGCFV